MRRLPEYMHAPADKYNKSMFRKRAAPLARPESVAVGDWYDTLIPSPNHVQCLVWGSMWSNDPDALREMGFVKIRCEATESEPAREWKLAAPTPGQSAFKEVTDYIDAQWAAFDETPVTKRTKNDLKFAYDASIMTMVGLRVSDENKDRVIAYNLAQYRKRSLAMGLTGVPQLDKLPED